MSTNPQNQTTQELKQPTEFHFDIIKLEYEQTAQRFENIYQAIWQIFSYLSAVAAAIVAFGVSNLSMSVVVVIALLPLIFWFFAIYIPMDFYGHRVGARLAEMEDGFNEKFLKDYPDALKLKLFEDFKKLTKAQPNYSRSKLRSLKRSKLRSLKRSKLRSFKRLKLRFLIWFKGFLKWLNNLWQNLNNSWQIHWRVRYAISVFALLAVVVCLLGLFDITHNITSRNFSNLEADPSRMEIKLEAPVQVQTQSPQLQELKKELLELFDKKLDENLDSIRSLINTKNTATPTNNAGKPRQ